MSPEQARGQSVDKRADVWAFGVVLFEMMAGRQIFSGDTVSDTLAAVLKIEPEWKNLPPNLHPRIRLLLERCLKKDPKNRYSSISDARVDIQEVLADPSGVLTQPVTTLEPRTRLRAMLPWVAAALLLGLIIAGVAVWKLKPSEPLPVTRLYYELGKDQQFGNNFTMPLLAVSPDGRKVAYCTPGGIYLHSMEEWSATPIQGTEGNPQQPFFSPDGKWIGYWSLTDNQFKKIRIGGGVSVTLTDQTASGYLSWSMDDTIIFPGTKGIMRISANGGEAETLIEAKNETFFAPRFLPGGKAIIFTISTDEGYKVAVQPLQSNNHRTLTLGSDAHYSPTGHLVYILNNDLCAIPFDLEKLEITGGSITLVKNILRAGGAPQFDVSASGTLVYLQGTASIVSKRTLVWVDRNGKEEPLITQPNAYGCPRISPDGAKVALAIGLAPGHIYIWDLARKRLYRLFTDANPNAQDTAPLWTPSNGKQIAFYHQSGSNLGVDWMEANGTGNVMHLYSQPGYGIYPGCWSGDGKTLLTMSAPVGRESYDISMVSMNGDKKIVPLLGDKYSEFQPQISPNGRWIAYSSDESGMYEVWVRPFPEVRKGHWQVSTGGGDSPLWAPDGRELFYRSQDAVMVVSVQTDADFTFEAPKSLFRGTYVSADARISTLETHPWDISPDSKRFLMMKESEPVTDAIPRKINIVLNWFEELK